MNQMELRDMEILENPDDYRSLFQETPEEYTERMLAKLILTEVTA